MSKPYEVRIPLRTEGITLPEIDLEEFKIQETTRSRMDESLTYKTFELVAGFDAEANEVEERRSEIYQRAQRLAQILSFLTCHGIVAETPWKTYRSDQSVQHIRESAIFPMPREMNGLLFNIFTSVEESNEIDEGTMRALRWYALGLASERPKDRLIMFWFTLENQSKPKEISKQKQGHEFVEAVEHAEDVVKDEIKENDVRSRLIEFLKRDLRWESIPEAVAREVKETLGNDHPRIADDLEEEMKACQTARSDLVHNGSTDKNEEELANKLESYCRFVLQRKLSPVFRGKYESKHFPAATTASNPQILEMILANYPQGLTENELLKEAFTATRDMRKAARAAAFAKSPEAETRPGVAEKKEDGNQVYFLKK
ncbi:HEPN domain-containing protein [Halogeometricum sp. S1BR25-6]|uniref:HEPN domain-containing protein n=1 Tax=Halogeometricum salsisoli TaxID=2950536 RepID=A0ABU2GJB7_9EURY|nr:HEPN domain-containing protein [Halogeometricum sp. S1BR25-6]MDS0300916.1 HEPN domain-containing protein [Halogeometricum sp. S1BR25-6]